MERIYLDHNATSPLDPAAREAVVAALPNWGNASSVHFEGRRARELVETAREAVAALVGADRFEIFFTSGATEANHIAIRALAKLGSDRGRHVLSTVVEHPSVLGALDALGAEGFGVARVPVDALGRLDPERFAAHIGPQTVVASVMGANNETGNLYDVELLARACRERGVRFHSDITQLVGRVPVDLHAIGCDAASFSGHKLGGPPGVGVLYVRRGTPLGPLLPGGHQERGLRAGTENVIGIVGLGAIAGPAKVRASSEVRALAEVRDRFWTEIQANVAGVVINGDPDGARRLPNTLNVSIGGAASEVIVIALDLAGFSVSAGSACSAGTLEPSHVLRAMSDGSPAWEARIRSALRVSIGHAHGLSHAREFARALGRAVATARAATPEDDGARS